MSVFEQTDLGTRNPADSGGSSNIDEPALAGIDVSAGAPRHVLVCTDRSPVAAQLMRHGVALAHVWNSQMTLMHVVEADHEGDPLLPTHPLDWQLRIQEARLFLADTVFDSGCGDLDFGTELGEGKPFEQIQAWSNAHDVDLTVIASHGEGGRSCCGLAGTAHKLIEGLDGSLMVVPTSEAPAKKVEEAIYRKILVPLDGSLHAASVLPWATRIGEAHGSELILTHVVPTPELTRIGPPEEEDIELEELLIRRNERVATKYLTDIRSHLGGSGFTTRIVLARKGNPRDELSRIIHEQGVDLVVLSAHGATGATDRSLGSVAAHLISHSRAPMLVVRRRTKAQGAWDRACGTAVRRVPARLPSMTAA